MASSGHEHAAEPEQLIRFGVVTALPKEFAAMVAMLDESRPHSVPGDPNDYVVGSVPAIDGSGVHHVVVTLLKKPGNNSAAAAATNLLRSFPGVDDVLMVGIAGGCPQSAQPDKHVRLGDIVISDQYGVLQYDNIKLADGAIETRDTSAPPSAALLGKVRVLEAARVAGDYRWEEHIPRAATLEAAARPDSSTDHLLSSHDPPIEVPHPVDPYRRPRQPKIHYGRIGSANVLLKNRRLRDALRDAYNVRAIEMEGSGIADGTWTAHQSYILIRGICDYCDATKDDTWQGYAAVVAAAYARALIEAFPAQPDPVKLKALTDAHERLKEADAHRDESRFETAARAYKQAADLARLAQDPQVERGAHLQAARAIGQHVLGSPVDESTRTGLIAEMHAHLDSAEQLGASGARVFAERALAARLTNQPREVLRWAEATLNAADADTADQADALIARLEALTRLGQHEAALALDDDVKRVRLLVEGDARLALDATWLFTLSETGGVLREHIEGFGDEVRGLVDRETVSRRRAAIMLGDVAAGLNRRGRIGEALELCALAYDIAEATGDAKMLTTIALQIAELAAQQGDAARARLYLGRAESSAERCKPSSQHPSDVEWASLRAIVLFARGRILTRLGDQRDAGAESDRELLEEAYRSFEEGRSFSTANRHALQGDVEIYLADISWWSGRVADALGRSEEAAAHFRAVRSAAAMAHSNFSSEVGMDAWLCEAEALRLAGRLREASDTVDRLLKETGRRLVPERVTTRARAFREYLDKRELALLAWFQSADAHGIARSTLEKSLHEAVSEQISPLVSWWEVWHEEKVGPESELLDFWARGGFSRVAAAIRAKPHAAIAVDASSIEEIRRSARIFCPLFDTILVKWKGDLGAGMVIVPVHWRYGGPSSYGGHGYSVTAGTKVREDWTVAVGWANPLPREVTAFLSSEALPLVSAGRLVVVPAPLVGCTQSAVGWTDDLLVSSLLGGVVNAVGKRESGNRITGSRQRILDLSAISIPFIENVALADLARALDETAEWVRPLKELLLKSINSEDLRWERWDRIAALESDIRDACRRLHEHLRSFTARRKRGNWRASSAPGSISSVTRSHGGSGREPITDALRAVAPVSPELAPWIPYWRLETFGGHLEWMCPLDNPSKLPDRPEIPREVHGWLYPGTPGWGFAVARRRDA